MSNSNEPSIVEYASGRPLEDVTAATAQQLQKQMPDAGQAARIIARKGGTATAGTDRDQEAAQETFSYLIRDMRNDGAVIDADVIRLEPGESDAVARLIAAERLADYEGRDGVLDHDFTIEVFQGREPGTGPPLHRLDADSALRLTGHRERVIARGREGDAQAKDIEGGSAAVADVLRAERHRLRDSIRRYDDPAADTDATGARAEPEESFAEKRDGVLDRLNRVETRLRAVEAEREWADSLRSAADQDRAAADIYERLAEQGEHEGVAAVQTAARGYKAAPSARLRRAMSSRSSRGRGSLNLRRLITQRLGRSGAER